METSTVRLKHIEISNFKNVKHGVLDLSKSSNRHNANFLGLYGQNGSGKTALIDVLHLLKLVLCGQLIPDRFGEYVNVDASFSRLKFSFGIVDEKSAEDYTVVYQFSLRKEEKEESDFAFASEEDASLERKTSLYRAVIFDEVLSWKKNKKNAKLKPMMDTHAEDKVFVPQNRYEELIGNDKKLFVDLLASKRYAEKTSRGFIFSGGLRKAIHSHCEDMELLFPYDRLCAYGFSELFVISAANSGLVAMNALPLAFKLEKKGNAAMGNLMLSLDKASLVSQDVFDIVKDIIPNMNIVLEQLVPGLKIGAKKIGSELLKDGESGVWIQLVSCKNSVDIPLSNESDGIKKIISVLNLLIRVYNESSITVAVDELDAGIFEYLLGELLRIVSEKGQGQLIFTSHNLRPLETLDRGFIAFTTTNPEKRYIRLSGVKANHNLRDFYYRDIVLGEQNEPVYEDTNNAEISLAFRKAGEKYGS